MDEKALLDAIRGIVKEETAQIVAPLITRMDDIEHSHKAIRADIATLNHEIIPKVNAMYDSITGINEKFNRLDRLEDKVENQGNRILALEYAVKAK